MKNFFASCQELVFPSSCLGCDTLLPWRDIPLFCPGCRDNIRAIDRPLCPCCGMPFAAGEDHLCGPCLEHTFAFDLARSALNYQPPVTHLLGALKFQGQLTGLSSLAALARASSGFHALSRPDIILPVPLHPRRLRGRGFNQALLIARALFPGQLALIHPRVLQRQRPTLPQAELSGSLRRTNLTGAFSVLEPHQVKDKTLLLIDDIFTTGSTVHECAKVLRRAGAKRIEVFTLARAM